MSCTDSPENPELTRRGPRRCMDRRRFGASMPSSASRPATTRTLAFSFRSMTSTASCPPLVANGNSSRTGGLRRSSCATPPVYPSPLTSLPSMAKMESLGHYRRGSEPWPVAEELLYCCRDQAGEPHPPPSRAHGDRSRCELGLVSGGIRCVTADGGATSGWHRDGVGRRAVDPHDRSSPPRRQRTGTILREADGIGSCGCHGREPRRAGELAGPPRGSRRSAFCGGGEPADAISYSRRAVRVGSRLPGPRQYPARDLRSSRRRTSVLEL